MPNLRTALRKAIVALLKGDAALKTFFPTGVVNVSYRPTRQPLTLPRITFFDFGDRADDTVPLWDRDVQFDVWDGDMDKCEDIAQRVLELLDHSGLAMPGNEGQTARVHVVSESDATQEDADLARKSMRVRVLAYDYQTPYSNN